MVASKSRGIIFIGGGVGPQAGTILHRKIIEATPNCRGDGDHRELLHLSFSCRIPDRTAFLLEGEGENPGEAMARLMEPLLLWSLAEGLSPAVGVPCNTFHAPLIFGPFLSRFEALPGVKIIHMLEETAFELERRLSPGEKVGLLSTTGTRRSGVWRHLLESRGFPVEEVPESDQEGLHEAIYHPRWGLKSSPVLSDRAALRFRLGTEELIRRGAKAILLGCTEIPLALPGVEYKGIPLVDPMDSLARALVAATD